MLGIKSSKPGSCWGGALLLSCTPLQKSWLAWWHAYIIQEIRAGRSEVQGRPRLLCKHRAKLWCSMGAHPPPQKSSSKVKWWLYLYKCLSKLEGHCYSVLLAWALGSPLVTVWSVESLRAMTPAPRDMCMVLSLNMLWDRWIELTPGVVPCSCSPLPVPMRSWEGRGKKTRWTCGRAVLTLWEQRRDRVFERAEVSEALTLVRTKERVPITASHSLASEDIYQPKNAYDWPVGSLQK